ncbi:MAG TPA: glycosyltransferase family 4 protein [Syntrophomonadaceae bacterium]|nr:glycosyltransferase family 4 protein [Syntrophomonadaceae bacterium]
MNIVNIGTYPPKQCGIATFSMDLRKSLQMNGHDVRIISVSEEASEYVYPSEVIFNIRQQHKQDYIKAANLINSSSFIDMVIIQHEYGIYGSREGELVMELAKLLHRPYVLVTHTVLPQPSKHQKQVLNYLCHRASGIVCMTRRSANLLANLYEAPEEVTSVIAHGVPNFPVQSSDVLKTRYGLQGRDIVSTFGLIGPGKGLELGIKAMQEVCRVYPQSLYLILGQTHPMLRKTEGEKYRHMLEGLVDELGLRNHVAFVNRFLSDDELGEFLYLTDIYLSPYPNRDQAVSGTLAFALGCGRAIVSTSYAYACEVLAEGRGLIADKTDYRELSALIQKILADPDLKSGLQTAALNLGKSWTWVNVGRLYTNFFNKILDTPMLVREKGFNYAKL